MFNEESLSREQQKENTKNRILDTARSVFENSGYEKATIRQIAKKAGVSPGSIIHHFTDKTELLYEVLYLDLERVGDLSAHSSGKDLQTATERIFLPYFDYYQSSPDLSRILLKEALFAKHRWSELFRAQAERSGKKLIDALEIHSQKVGRIIDTKTSAASVISFYYFSLLLWISDSKSNPAVMFRTLTKDYYTNIFR